ncbi:helix-turn-helix domain-containing protein [Microbacterium sp. 20-116]|uniref:helix-turn-helix domain-containing protein n=1 Tax=Microbacterium sp. 20-116 TaxID=3239883 RepID=UPI0034E2EA6F
MCTPRAVLADILRDRGIFAKADTSVVYDRLQHRLTGYQPPAPQESPRNAVRGRQPGLNAPVVPPAPAKGTAEVAVTSHIVGASELAKLLSCSTASVYRMARADEIPSMSVGRQWRFEVAEVLRALREPVDLWKQPGRSWSAKRTR